MWNWFIRSTGYLLQKLLGLIYTLQHLRTIEPPPNPTERSVRFREPVVSNTYQTERKVRQNYGTERKVRQNYLPPPEPKVRQNYQTEPKVRWDKINALFGTSNQGAARKREASAMEVYEIYDPNQTYDLDFIVLNSALNPLIFSYLEAKDLTKCRLVSKNWKAVIDAHKDCQWWIRHLKSIKTMKKKFKRSCTDKSEENRTLEQFPEWNEYFIYLETNGNLENIKRFVVIMQEYRKASNTYGCPYGVFCDSAEQNCCPSQGLLHTRRCLLE